MRVFKSEVQIGVFLYVTLTALLPVEVGGRVTCSCYQYESQGFGWQRNREECQKSGGDLVATETEEEWEFVKNKIQMKSTSGSDEWYIGLYRNASTGNWTWVSGEPLTLQKWQPNKPYDDSSKNAAVITKSFPAGTHGLFKNVNGNTKYWAYICEVTRTSGCFADCWFHPNRTKNVTPTTEVTSSEPQGTSARIFQSTNEGTSTTTTSPPIEGSAAPRADSKAPLVLILAVVLGVLFVVVAVVLGVFLYKRFNRSRQSPTTKAVKQQSSALENPGSKPEAIYHEAAKLLGTPKQDQNQSGAEVPEYQDVKNNTYAVVDKSKKKKREDETELCYAELGEADPDVVMPTKPAPYQPTEYAEVVGTVAGSADQSEATTETRENQHAAVA